MRIFLLEILLVPVVAERIMHRYERTRLPELEAWDGKSAQACYDLNKQYFNAHMARSATLKATSRLVGKKILRKRTEGVDQNRTAVVFTWTSGWNPIENALKILRRRINGVDPQVDDVTILNPAHAVQPGGEYAYSDRPGSLEEDLCRQCPNLFPSFEALHTEITDRVSGARPVANEPIGWFRGNQPATKYWGGTFRLKQLRYTTGVKALRYGNGDDSNGASRLESDRLEFNLLSTAAPCFHLGDYQDGWGKHKPPLLELSPGVNLSKDIARAASRTWADRELDASSLNEWRATLSRFFGQASKTLYTYRDLLKVWAFTLIAVPYMLNPSNQVLVIPGMGLGAYNFDPGLFWEAIRWNFEHKTELLFMYKVIHMNGIKPEHVTDNLGDFGGVQAI